MIEMNIPLDPGVRGEPAKALDASLRRMIVGQDPAIHQIVSAYQMYLSGLIAPGRPVANFLFLGPTGSGKTHIVEATAETLLKTSRALLKIDCAEFQHTTKLPS